MAARGGHGLMPAKFWHWRLRDPRSYTQATRETEESRGLLLSSPRALCSRPKAYWF